MGGGQSSRAEDFADARDQRGACSAGADTSGADSGDLIDVDANIRRQVVESGPDISNGSTLLSKLVPPLFKIENNG